MIPLLAAGIAALAGAGAENALLIGIFVALVFPASSGE